MALLYLEDFEGYTSIRQAGWRTYPNASDAFDASVKYNGTQSFKKAGAYTYIVRYFGDINPLIIGFAIRFSGQGSQNMYFLNILGEGSDFQCGLRYQNNRIDLKRSNSVILGSTSGISDNTWYYLEMRIEIANSISSGNGIVKLNGTTEINLAATTDTQYCSTDTVLALNMEVDYGIPDKYWHVDNMYICDTTGSDNNDILGMPLIDTLYPNDNGNQNDFVGSDADSVDNYLLVDDSTIDEGTTYVESETVNDVDLYGLGTMSANYAIYGIAVSSVCVTPGGGKANFQHVVRTNSTDYPGATKYAKGSDNSTLKQYRNVQTIWENNPNDSQPWEKADIDGLEAGVKVVS